MLKNNKVNLTFLFEIKDNFEGEKNRQKKVYLTQHFQILIKKIFYYKDMNFLKLRAKIL